MGSLASRMIYTINTLWGAYLLQQKVLFRKILIQSTTQILKTYCTLDILTWLKMILQCKHANVFKGEFSPSKKKWESVLLLQSFPRSEWLWLHLSLVFLSVAFFCFVQSLLPTLLAFLRWNWLCSLTSCFLPLSSALVSLLMSC